MPINDHVKSVIIRMVNLVCVLRRIPHDFFRHATDIDAGTAQRAIFYGRRIRSVFGSTLNMREATTASSYYQEVKIICHPFLRRCINMGEWYL
jgi:hypothetical protein